MGRPARVASSCRAWRNHCVKVGLGRWVPALDPVTGEQLYNPPRGPRSKPKPKMIYEGRVFHDLRRAGIRNLVRAGVCCYVSYRSQSRARSMRAGTVWEAAHLDSSLNDEDKDLHERRIIVVGTGHHVTDISTRSNCLEESLSATFLTSTDQHSFCFLCRLRHSARAPAS